jgi:hypothetical protein
LSRTVTLRDASVAGRAGPAARTTAAKAHVARRPFGIENLSAGRAP